MYAIFPNHSLTPHTDITEVDLAELGVVVRFAHEPEIGIISLLNQDIALLVYTKIAAMVKAWKHRRKTTATAKTLEAPNFLDNSSNSNVNN